MTRLSWAASAGAAALAIVVGCSSSGGGTGPSTGMLTVTVTAGSGVTPSVTVAGPGGYSHAIANTQTLSGLAAGSYTISAADAVSSGPIVASVFSGAVSGSPASVTAGNTAAATVTYTQRPGTGGLWVGNASTLTVVQYGADQLASGTAAAPAVTLQNSANVDNASTAFDTKGNLWVGTYGGSVIEFTASQLASSNASLTPQVTLTANGGGVLTPFGLAFDGNGNLWVANLSASAIDEYSASQLIANGNPAPAAVLTLDAHANPSALAFDAAGNLWVALNADHATIVEFHKADLVNGTPTPAVTLTPDGSWNSPSGIAFDPSGNLWVANSTGPSVIEFATALLGASAAPTPTITLSNGVDAPLSAPVAVAFDASGNLWVANFGNSTVIEYAQSALGATGTPAATATLSGSGLGEPKALAFDPHATGLPLH